MTDAAILLGPAFVSLVTLCTCHGNPLITANSSRSWRCGMTMKKSGWWSGCWMSSMAKYRSVLKTKRCEIPSVPLSSTAHCNFAFSCLSCCVAASPTRMTRTCCGVSAAPRTQKDNIPLAHAHLTPRRHAIVYRHRAGNRLVSSGSTTRMIGLENTHLHRSQKAPRRLRGMTLGACGCAMPTLFPAPSA